MTDRKDQPAMGRRGFLGAIGGLASVAAAAAVVAAPPAQAQAVSRDDKLRARYRETDHVKAFYRTARYRKEA